MSKRILPLATLIVISIMYGYLQSGPEREIAAYLDDLAENGWFSGAVLIAHEGKPILARAYGLANRDYEIPNQVGTKLYLGSMNKMFTAIAVLQLV